MKARRYAFFDLDYTLIPHDTLLLFCDYVLKKERLRSFFVFIFAPAVPLAVLRILRGAALKRVFLSFLWRIPADRLDRYARDFVQTRVVPEIYPEMRAKLEAHQQAGDLVILNTASPEFYVRYIAEDLGVEHFFATRLDFQERMPFVPGYIGRNNKRMAKMEAMRDLLPAEAAAFLKENPNTGPEDPQYARNAIPGARAYSDSTADLPMLLLSEAGEVVHPGKTLRELAEKNGWTILSPERGYTGSFTRYAHSLLQLFGLYTGRDLRTS